MLSKKENEIKLGKEIFESLRENEKRQIEAYFVEKITYKLTQSINEKVRYEYQSRMIKKLKSLYKDCDTKQRQANINDYAYAVFQAKKEYIHEICDNEDLDFLYVSGKKDHKK